ncbi:MAG: OFA family MFS transporter [Clostridiales bacterium]|nr:OFA family MFS transporter [Clostridiales bacterium]
MKRLHYGWVICFVFLLVFICIMGLLTNVFSVFGPYLVSERGLTNGECSMLSTIRCFFALVAMAFVEPFYRKVGTRLGLPIAMVMTALCFGIYALGRGPLWCDLAAAVGGLAYGIGTMVPISILISRWFAARRALALSAAASGSGVATVIFSPLFTGIIEKHGLTVAFTVEALLVLVCGAVVFILLRNSPREMGLAPYGTGERSKEAASAARQGHDLSRGGFAAALVAVMLIGADSNAASAHLAILFRSEGIDAMLVATGISIFGLLLTCGKFICGAVTDRLGGYGSNWIFGGILTLGFILTTLAGQHSTVLMFAALCLLGLGFPPSTVGIATWAGDFSSEEHFSRTLGRFQSAYLVGGLVFSTLPGLIADRTGSYVPAFELFTLGTVACFGILQILYYLNVEREKEPLKNANLVAQHQMLR